MLLPLCLLLVATALTGAVYIGDAFVVEFRRSLTPILMHRVENLIGYSPTLLVAHNGLLLYLNAEQHLLLSRHFSVSIRTIARLSGEDRCALPLRSSVEGFDGNLHLQTMGPAEEGGGGGGGLETRSLHRRSEPVPPPDSTLLLRAVIHPEAHTIETNLTDILQSNVTDAVGPDYPIEWRDDFLFYVTNVSTMDAPIIANRLSRICPIIWIETTRGPQLLNLWQTRFNQGLPSTPNQTLVTSIARCPYAECMPIWDAGLQGESQIISISDTGVREQQCYFDDPIGRSFPLVSDRTCPTSGACYPADLGHRKIRAYWIGTGGDSSDSHGHGTHVCGSLTGAANGGGPLQPPPLLNQPALRADRFDGTARLARLAFVDVHRSGSANLFIPEPYDSRLLTWSRTIGARIHSASWGAADFRYSLDDVWFDAFAWTNRDFLSVVAAGNSGAAGAGTILSPGLSKNVLTVGATLSSADAYDLAAGAPARPYPADAYTPDWVTDYSSHGSSLISGFIKPDVVAPGGPYTWSANAFGVASASCADVGGIVAGLAGTSMATPSVAASVALIRDYFFQGFYPSRTRTPGNSLNPMASLLRAIVVGGAQLTRGVFPQRTFASIIAGNVGAYQPYGRQFIEGFGRLNLLRSLPLRVDAPRRMLILGNEEAATTMSRAGQLVRHCLSARGSTLREITVVLAWTDYPQQSGQLVNDLDLRVEMLALARTTHYPNGLNDADHSNNVERIRLQVSNSSSTIGFQISVQAARIGFLTQSYSLVVLAEGSDIDLRLESTSTTTSGQCVRCANGQFLDSSLCATCGDGRIDVGEQCDSNGPCCNPTTCQFRADDSPCNATLNGCPVPGQCSSLDPSAACSVLQTAMMSMFILTANNCSVVSPSPVPTPPPSSMTPQPTPPPSGGGRRRPRAPASWIDAILQHNVSQPSTVANVCCLSWLDFVTDNSTTVDPLLNHLHQHTIIARANIVIDGLPISGITLQHLLDAEQLLNQTCGQFLSGQPHLIHQAHVHYDALHEFNTDGGLDLPECDQLRHNCAQGGTDQQRADLMYCSQAAGRYVWQTGQCNCHSNRHPSEPDCRHLHCNGRGVSIYDYDEQRLRCQCLPGYSGEQCTQCAHPSDESLADQLQYLCVGLLLGAPQTHALQLVDSATLAARLDGSFYSTLAKNNDSLPNGGSLDCWCRQGAPPVASFDTHKEAVQAAFAYWERTLYLSAYLPTPSLLQATEGMATTTSPPNITTRRRSDSWRLRPLLLLWILLIASIGFLI